MDEYGNSAGNGYIGYSMSVNAADAYDRGLRPISKLTAADMPLGVSLSFARWLAKTGEWRAAEWHHTSAKFNRTDFYDPAEIAAIGNLRALREKYFQQKLDKPEPSSADITARWPVFEKYGRRWKFKEHEIKKGGKIKGDFVIFPDGSRKKIDGKHLEFAKKDEADKFVPAALWLLDEKFK